MINMPVNFFVTDERLFFALILIACDLLLGMGDQILD
jgi:hypothetical protein